MTLVPTPEPEETPAEGELLDLEYDRLAVLGGYGLPAAHAQREEREAREDAHAVQRIPYPWGVAWTCACGQWEAVATGPSSARWAGDDHRRHVHDTTPRHA